MRELVKKFLVTTGGILGTLLIGVVAFTNFSPQLGGTPTRLEKQAFAKSGHYDEKKGEFVNLIPTREMTGGSMPSVLWKFLFHKSPQAAPPGPLPMRPLDSLAIVRKTPDVVRITWFGHSASLLEIAGQNILLDPMLSVEMGPVSWATPNRYNRELVITPEKLPYIAAVLISHDHYDHLDFRTIEKIKDKVGQFYVPLGIGAHLRAWGVPRERITEMNWGDQATLPGLLLHCTPSRHFSGRGLTNRNSTMWCSWVVQAPTKRVFYTGDGGYGPHFAAIGQQYGPFDLAVVECGQYNESWADIHMKPEQSVQAARDVRAAVMLPVHWGAFTESLHAWNEPVTRATAEAARLGQVITTPHLGEPVTLGAALPQQRWWEK
ncbi:MBL fold metallo-hydrolase [Hymenobacter armeniacus]|uniref:MBL fold metallo-hydrolase n=1 Tax=Hymenobacter armeniacus TaxID=2771358 RepID=A0ABR8JRB0_9BACT|nr:MBL fold metallo-hydrolase [Hymenobacter armeniacus]MBD2722511.1 MBL fold metallo-hydrolase [Hymenobacter armeniacus]